MLIDWLTIRHPITPALGEKLFSKLQDNLCHVVKVDAYGVEVWRKSSVDFESLRSDSGGLFWSTVGDGQQYFLVVGGSPSSIVNQGVNVFGSLDIREGAELLRRAAAKCLDVGARLKLTTCAR